jgi:ATP-dependent DNA helicase DinG
MGEGPAPSLFQAQRKQKEVIMETQTQLTARHVLGPGGITREVRQPQIDMAELVAKAIAERKSAVIEGGTGTGKSLGYLVPAIAGHMRIAVSTATKALQDQLAQKDMPYLADAFARHYGITFKHAVLKGASNYLCNRRASDLDEAAPEAIPPAVRDWIDFTPTGDLADGPEMADDLRDGLRVDLDDCEKKKCPFYDRCHFRAAREKAEAADVLILNHALLSLTVTTPNLVDLSGFDAVVIDEAHQFEEVFREAVAGRLQPGTIRQTLKDAEKMLVPADGLLGTPDQLERWATERQQWADLRDRFRVAALDIMLPWMEKTEDEIKRRVRDADTLAPLEHVRTKGAIAARVLSDLAFWVRSRLKEEDPKHRRLSRQIDTLAEFFQTLSNPDVIAVVRRRLVEDEKFARVVVESYPLAIGPRLQETLYPIVPVIYTSATISTGGPPAMRFTAIKEALGLTDCYEMELPSPFDYPRQSLLYIPRGFPEPKHPDYSAEFLWQLDRLIKMSQGGAFVLFTSTAAMNYAFKAMRHLHYPMRVQDQTPKGHLIEWFKQTPNAVLFATQSFWEGVSIEGSALRLVIIDKLPFPPPSDPIYKAKAAALIAKGKKDFFDLSVPTATIKLKQGFGRLIRTQSDHGVVAILDSRLVGKPYGRSIVAALPPAKLVEAIDGNEALFAAYLKGVQEREAPGFLDDEIPF